MSLLIKNARFLIQDARTIAEQADLLVSGNRIAAVGRDLDAPPEATVIDATGRVVMPGFVNAHTHLYQTLLRGRRDDLPLQEWLAEVIFPFTNEIQAGAKNGETEIGYCWSMLGALEMVRGGITACINMDKTLPSVFEAWQDLGFRGVGALNAANQWIPPELMIGDAERKAEILRYVDRWHGAGADALIDVCLAPSTAYACTPDFFRWLVETAACRRLWFHIHVSETPWDVTFCREHYGLTPLAYLDTLGLLDHHVTAAHCVFLTGEEIALAARKGVVPVYNPKSNAKLGNGVAPIVEMLAAGMTVALGTDGPASNDSMDLFEEMRAAAMLQKVHHRDATLLSAATVFDMATAGGARAARLDAGVLRPGKLADVVILDLDGPHIGPVNDLLQTIVYCSKASDVRTTIIDGRILMRDRRILPVDEPAIIGRARELAAEYQRRAVGKQLKTQF